jgi:hypothetical protein
MDDFATAVIWLDSVKTPAQADHVDEITQAQHVRKVEYEALKRSCELAGILLPEPAQIEVDA